MLFWFVLGPILLALISYLLHHVYIRNILIFLGQFTLLIGSVIMLLRVRALGARTDALGNYESWLSINLVADNIAMLFVVITSMLFFFLIYFNYHKHYMNHLFLFLFLTLEGLINGIFLSSDLFDLFALIEVSTVLVSILIMYKKDNQSIYDGIVYLLTNIVAMTFFLFGIGYIYKIFGSLDLNILHDLVHEVDDSRSLILPYTFLITAIGLKSALMPLFSWLPRAHGTPSAPSIVSAILSGLYVKGGLYLFIRFQFLFGEKLDTHGLFLIMGFLTAVIGFIFALSQTDIKLLLAYSTVSQIGLMILGLSIGTPYSYYGSIYHVVNHAVFKSTLFITAGIIIEAYGTRDLRQIQGVLRRLPIVGFVILVAILGITGAPLFNGSISKYMIQSTLDTNILLEYSILFINLGTIITYIKYAHILVGDPHKPPYPIRYNQKLAMVILALITLLGGILGEPLVNFLFDLHLDIHLGSYIKKTFVFAVSLLIGLLFYIKVFPKLHFFKTIREIELSFNEIIFSIVFFFGAFLTYLSLTI